jgi:hypothetical protein
MVALSPLPHLAQPWMAANVAALLLLLLLCRAGASEVYGRDYSAPTGEDNFDKSALPEVMQVREGGGAPARVLGMWWWSDVAMPCGS